MKILMMGPMSKHGGVSTHTREIINSLKNKGNDIIFFNIYNRLGDRTGQYDIISFFNNLYKLYSMTIGLFLNFIKYKNKVDIIHIQSSGPIFGFLSGMTGSFLKYFTKKKIIITFHHSKTKKFLKRYYKIFIWVLKNIDGLIVVSKKQKNIIEKYCGKKYGKKIFIVPNGYNPKNFLKIPKKEAKTSLGFSNNKIVLINVALLLEKKGHIYLIESIDRLVNMGYNNIICIIVGKGPMKKKLKNQIINRNMEEKIILTGYVEDKLLIKYMNSADFFILPSLDEGNPIVMFEALSLGLPFIGTNVGGIPEIINNENIGMIVEPGNSDLLTELIIKAINKKWNRKDIIEYSKEFTWDRIALKTENIYNLIRRDYSERI